MTRLMKSRQARFLIAVSLLIAAVSAVAVYSHAEELESAASDNGIVLWLGDPDMRRD